TVRRPQVDLLKVGVGPAFGKELTGLPFVVVGTRKLGEQRRRANADALRWLVPRDEPRRIADVAKRYGKAPRLEFCVVTVQEGGLAVLVIAQKRLHFAREILEAHRFALQKMRVKRGGPPHRLRGVVDENV